MLLYPNFQLYVSMAPFWRSILNVFLKNDLIVFKSNEIKVLQKLH